jgi:enoyl-CoA hydratase/carnithine racemase
VLREEIGNVGIITLNNEKKRNPLSKEVLNALQANLKYYADNRQKTKVVIIKAKGTSTTNP